MSINERDWVIHTKSGNRGQVLEIADGIAYIELENGVEMDFSISDLILESEHKSPEEERQEDMALADDTVRAVAELILPEVKSIFITLAQRLAASSGLAVIALGGSAAPWEEMNAYHKMNFISVSTGTKFIDWVNAYNDGNMAVFQLSILVALGERASK